MQRVSRAGVSVAGETAAMIGPGLLILIGVAVDDTSGDAEYIAGKIARMRIFADRDGNMNLSALDAGGQVLLVSQFTLLADTRKGNRPGFSGAAPPENAEGLFLEVAEHIRSAGIEVQTGVFGAMMKVELVNDGPVTIILDSRR